MAAESFDGPGQCRGGGFVAGDQQRQQLVGEVFQRDGRPVVVAGPQEQRQHVSALVELGIGAGVVDELLHDHVEATPELAEPSARAPRSEVAPGQRWQHGESRTEQHRGREQFTQVVEGLALRAEHGPQDRTQGDPHHRFQCRKLDVLRPGRDLAERLLLDELFVGLHPLAVEGRNEQLAPLAVWLAVEAEARSGSQHRAEVGFQAEQVRTGGEDVLDEVRVADHHRLAEDGQVQRHDWAESLARQSH